MWMCHHWRFAQPPNAIPACSRTREGAVYRFESLDSGFTADVEVDAAGLVVTYPGLFQRQWSSPGEVPSGESAQPDEEKHSR